MHTETAFPLTGPIRFKKRIGPRTYRPEIRNPRQMGAKAFQDGLSGFDNPFAFGTGQSRRWAAGYIDAKRKAA